MIAVIVLTVVYLCQLAGSKSNPEVVKPQTTDTRPLPVVTSPTRSLSEEKIAILKQLKSDGTITDAEYKKRALEILDLK